MLSRPYPYVARDTAKMSVSAFVGYLKGKSSLMIYEQFGELKFKYRNREFWCRGYYVDTVGKNKAKIAEYIRHQLAEDKLGEQLSIPYAGSPFTGRRQQKCRCQTVHAPARARLVRKPYRRIRGTTGYAGGAPFHELAPVRTDVPSERAVMFSVPSERAFCFGQALKAAGWDDGVAGHPS